MTRRDFEYLRLVTRVAPRKLQEHPGAIADLIQWVQRKLGGADELIGRLGLMGKNANISVGDLAVHLAALGFEGDALQAATRAARNDGGNHVTAESLRQLFSSTPPSQAILPMRTYPGIKNSASEQWNGNSARGAWNNGVCDLVAQNKTRPQGQRYYFSAPKRNTGMGAEDWENDVQTHRKSCNAPAPQKNHVGILALAVLSTSQCGMTASSITLMSTRTCRQVGGATSVTVPTDLYVRR